MFLKTIKAGNHTYAQIVESYKENGISKHRILLNFGRVESIKESRGIKKLIRSLSALFAFIFPGMLKRFLIVSA